MTSQQHKVDEEYKNKMSLLYTSTIETMRADAQACPPLKIPNFLDQMAWLWEQRSYKASFKAGCLRMGASLWPFEAKNIFQEAGSAADWMVSYVAAHTDSALWMSMSDYPSQLSDILFSDSYG